ncbi:hypothetical protein BZG36_00909 [Bifiguratus adelaidae]|uniref:Uncharacterized protein n=1 Tax=Bifiguratus adelaidae TaxID=1938954 RepID=A0A261Y5F2_9FUNG|nr:hypothetical protein BZG36_00909 [Bifiguratus adelaidae]
MEVIRSNFADALERVGEAIHEAEFLAIDAEFSGLEQVADLRKSEYDVEQYYIDIAALVKRYNIIQFGLCAFTWSAVSQSYISKPFNFYLFPTTTTGTARLDRPFSVQPSAIDFLAKHSFDFNKWLYCGIPWLTQAEEESLVQQYRNKVQKGFDDIVEDKKGKEYMETARIQIKQVYTSKDGFVNLVPHNAYLRRLVYQEIRNHHPDLIAQGRPGFIQVRVAKKDESDQIKQRDMDRFERDLSEARGFRAVFDMMKASRKPIVGHNLLVDIMMMQSQFEGGLPADFEAFKRDIQMSFPCILDTKFICETAAGLQIKSTSLDALLDQTSQYDCPPVDMHPAFTRYFEGRLHEAGYDAYVTGRLLIRLMYHLGASPTDIGVAQHQRAIAKSGPVGQNKHAKVDMNTLKAYYNKLNLSKGHFTVVNLDA